MLLVVILLMVLSLGLTFLSLIFLVDFLKDSNPSLNRFLFLYYHQFHYHYYFLYYRHYYYY